MKSLLLGSTVCAQRANWNSTNAWKWMGVREKCRHKKRKRERRRSNEDHSHLISKSLSREHMQSTTESNFFYFLFVSDSCAFFMLLRNSCEFQMFEFGECEASHTEDWNSFLSTNYVHGYCEPKLKWRRKRRHRMMWILLTFSAARWNGMPTLTHASWNKRVPNAMHGKSRSTPSSKRTY